MGGEAVDTRAILAKLTDLIRLAEGERSMVRNMCESFIEEVSCPHSTNLEAVVVHNTIVYKVNPSRARLRELVRFLYRAAMKGHVEISLNSVRGRVQIVVHCRRPESMLYLILVASGRFQKFKSLVETGEAAYMYQQDPYVDSRSCGDEAAQRSHKYRSIPLEETIHRLLYCNLSNTEPRIELQILDGSSPNTATWYFKFNMYTTLPALVMAMLAVQSTANPPGGKWQVDTPFHKAGDAVIASTRPHIYRFLVLTNTVAFSSALLTIFLNATGWPSRNIRLRWIAKSAMWVTLIAIALSYVGSTMAIAPNTKLKSVNPIVLIAVMLGSISITLAISGYCHLILLHLDWKRKRRRVKKILLPLI